MKNRMRTRFLLFLLAGCLVLTGCGGKAPAEETTENTENTEMMVLEEPTPVPEGLLIQSPVGDLEFPNELKDRVRLEEISQDGLYIANLYGSVGQKEALLFTIYMGETDIGYYFGAAPGSDGEKVEIRIEIEDFQGDETWSDSEADEVRQMQSRVNDLIGQINELPGFDNGR